jgi:hypothetical protein
MKRAMTNCCTSSRAVATTAPSPPSCIGMGRWCCTFVGECWDMIRMPKYEIQVGLNRLFTLKPGETKDLGDIKIE